MSVYRLMGTSQDIIVISYHEAREPCRRDPADAQGETMKSQIRINAERSPAYCPYCMRCPGLVRMRKIAHLYWECKCGAVHDERDK